MLRKVTAVRHAKSSWKNPGLSDIDRPLNRRGKRAAPVVAEYLRKLGHRPDVLLSSPAKRAYHTALAFAEVFGMEADAVLRDERLYFEGVSAIGQAISELDDSCKSVFFFSHEPVISEFCEEWCGWNEFKFPTAAACAMSFEADSWSSIRTPGSKLFFVIPKALSPDL